jgi:hypothetical protein
MIAIASLVITAISVGLVEDAKTISLSIMGKEMVTIVFIHSTPRGGWFSAISLVSWSHKPYYKELKKVLLFSHTNLHPSIIIDPIYNNQYCPQQGCPHHCHHCHQHQPLKHSPHPLSLHLLKK